MERIIWQPFSLYQPSFDFGIKLDRTFAKEMISTRIPQEAQRAMIDQARETAERFRFNYPEVLDFHEDTCLVAGFYIGNGGTWLTADKYDREKLMDDSQREKPLEYHSHNVDSSREAIALMALVDHWAEYSDILREQAVRD